jgi:hypothetical protein
VSPFLPSPLRKLKNLDLKHALTSRQNITGCYFVIAQLLL